MFPGLNISSQRKQGLDLSAEQIPPLQIKAEDFDVCLHLVLALVPSLRTHPLFLSRPCACPYPLLVNESFEAIFCPLFLSLLFHAAQGRVHMRNTIHWRKYFKFEKSVYGQT